MTTGRTQKILERSVAVGRLFCKIVYRAYLHFSRSDGWAMCSHVAMSILLALFPFLIFVVPRIMFSLHPSPVIPSNEGGGMDATKRIALYAGVFGFVGLYVWMQSLRVRIAALTRATEEA